MLTRRDADMLGAVDGIFELKNRGRTEQEVLKRTASIADLTRTIFDHPESKAITNTQAWYERAVALVYDSKTPTEDLLNRAIFSAVFGAKGEGATRDNLIERGEEVTRKRIKEGRAKPGDAESQAWYERAVDIVYTDLSE